MYAHYGSVSAPSLHRESTDSDKSQRDMIYAHLYIFTLPIFSTVLISPCMRVLGCEVTNIVS